MNDINYSFLKHNQGSNRGSGFSVLAIIFIFIALQLFFYLFSFLFADTEVVTLSMAVLAVSSLCLFIAGYCTGFCTFRKSQSDFSVNTNMAFIGVIILTFIGNLISHACIPNAVMATIFSMPAILVTILGLAASTLFIPTR